MSNPIDHRTWRDVLAPNRLAELEGSRWAQEIEVRILSDNDAYVYCRQSASGLTEVEALAVILGTREVPLGAKITNWKTPSPLVGGGFRYHVVLVE